MSVPKTLMELAAAWETRSEEWQRRGLPYDEGANVYDTCADQLRAMLQVLEPVAFIDEYGVGRLEGGRWANVSPEASTEDDVPLYALSVAP